MTPGEERNLSQRREAIDCPSCGVRAFPKAQWTSMSPEQRKASGGRLRQGDTCERCARGKELLDPAPGEELVEPQCSGCDAYMVTRAHWNKAGAEERQELVEEGYKVIQSTGTGVCRSCYERDRKKAA